MTTEPRPLDARARARLGAKGLLKCRICGSAYVEVVDQGTLGTLVICKAPKCLAAHTVFSS